MGTLGIKATIDITSWFGFSGWPKIQLKSDGEKAFEAKIKKAYLLPAIDLGTSSSQCEVEGSVTRLNAPLLYEDIVFEAGDKNRLIEEALKTALTFLVETNSLAAIGAFKRTILDTFNSRYKGLVLDTLLPHMMWGS